MARLLTWKMKLGLPESSSEDKIAAPTYVESGVVGVQN